MIPVYKPLIGETEKQYVMDALESTWVSSKGRYIDDFEKGFSEYCGANHGIAVCNGTVSLHLALLAHGVGAGDEVIVPTFTYVASVNAITYTGATPVFAESEPVHWNLDPADIEHRITSRTKAIMAVHLYGHPADMDPINEIAARHDLLVIEDAAEAHGALYKGRRTGSLGDIASFSFFGNKVITTGEGGMVLTNSPEVADACRHLRGQGVSATRTYWHDVVGYNYRMTNLAAAIGVAQLERVEEVIATKRRIAEVYAGRLRAVPGLTFQSEAEWASSVSWMVSATVEPELRDSLIEHLAASGIESRPFFYPAHTLPMYRTAERFPVAERIGASGINLPSFPELTDSQIADVCDVVEGFLADGGPR